MMAEFIDKPWSYYDDLDFSECGISEEARAAAVVIFGYVLRDTKNGNSFGLSLAANEYFPAALVQAQKLCNGLLTRACKQISEGTSDTRPAHFISAFPDVHHALYHVAANSRCAFFEPQAITKFQEELKSIINQSEEK